MQLQGTMGGEAIEQDLGIFNTSNYEITPIGNMEMSKLNFNAMLETSKLEDSKLDSSRLQESSKLDAEKLDASKVLDQSILSNSGFGTSKLNTPLNASKVEIVSKDMSFESGRFGAAT